MTAAHDEKDKTFPLLIEGLRKTFGGRPVLRNVGFHVSRGETIAVLGRSGVGKSVLLKLIVRLEEPDDGSIRVCGEEIRNLDIAPLNEARKKIGFLFQQGALYDSLSVEDNVAFPLARHKKISLRERRERARELLASVGMEQDRGKMPSEVSGGMQKRVGLARALALDPEILLFDEPTAGLDPITAAEIGKMIADLKQKRHIAGVVVTHDVRGAKMFSDRMLLLNEGAIVAEGTFEELKRNQDSFVRQFLADGP